MVKVDMKKWAAILCAALVIWAAVVAIVYRRKSSSEEERRSWNEHYHLSSETRAILEGSEKFALLSVDPISRAPEVDLNASLSNGPTNGATQIDTREYFHDHRMLGRTEIKDPKRKAELLAALYNGVEKYRGLAAPCFNPRHAIVATAGTNRVELLICFECDSGAEFTDSGQKW